MTNTSPRYSIALASPWNQRFEGALKTALLEIAKHSSSKGSSLAEMKRPDSLEASSMTSVGSKVPESR